MSKAYKVEFYSNDGHYNAVTIYACTEDEAMKIFEEGYLYDEFLSITEERE